MPVDGISLDVDFVPGVQDGLIADRGSKMIHEIALSCPKCRTSDTHANLVRDGLFQTRSPNCPSCFGDGWLYRSPFVVTGLATSIRQQNNIIDSGIAVPGDMQLSLSPNTFMRLGSVRMVSQYDKFTATWPQPLDGGQTIVRGAAHIDDNVRFVRNVSTDEDRLWYEPNAGIWCEDENGVSYEPSADFVLGPGRVVKWVGNRPVDGVKYVLKYTAFLEWLVFSPPQERVDRDNADLGPLVFLRKRHIAAVNDSPFITDTDRVPLSKRVNC